MINKLLNIFFAYFSTKYYTGVLPDNRSPLEIAKDWLHEEFAQGEPVIKYVTKEEADKKKKYSIYNQLSTLSCVAHATALEISIMVFNKFGKVFKGLALFIYRLRSNFSGGGMIGNNANEIALKYGIPSFDLYPYMEGETFANKIILTDEMYKDALNHRPLGYFKFGKLTWENIASVVSQGTAVKIFINATHREWGREFVQVLDKGPFPICHAITILDDTVFHHTDGEDYVLIQDSAWFGGIYYRYVPKSFFDAGRLSYSSYFTDLIYIEGQGEMPKYKFSHAIKYGDKGEDVKVLQEILIYEGCLAVGYNTGNFYGYTLKGVKKLQEKYASEILEPLGLSKGTGIVGLSTLKFLSKKYGV